MDLNLFLIIGMIFVLGYLGGWIFTKFHLPKLIWYMVLGILLGPSVFNLVDPTNETFSLISATLRQIALVIILTRSGLSMDLGTLKKIGRSAIMMCFVPATCEMLGVLAFGPLLLGISELEALLLGSVLAAVSPAVVVPFMLRLQDEKYGEKHHVSELIMAGASCDDIFVIVLFYAFKGLVATDTFDAMSIVNIPLSFILGVLLGIIIGFLLTYVFKKVKIATPYKVVIMLGFSFLMVATETLVKPWVSVSGLLGVITMAIILSRFLKDETPNIKNSYNSLWNGFEILLFALVGIQTDAKYAFSTEGAIILGLILIALVFRSIGVILCIIFTKYTWKERIFIIISYLPKATVQASIGGIALMEGLDCGELILTAAVISILVTAPLGAILMELLYKKLLTKDEDDNNDSSNELEVNNIKEVEVKEKA